MWGLWLKGVNSGRGSCWPEVQLTQSVQAAATAEGTRREGEVWGLWLEV